MHTCCMKRYWRALDPTISRGSVAHLRPVHSSAPTTALKTGHPILAQRWTLVQRMRGCKNIPPVKSVQEEAPHSKTLCSAWAPATPYPGCSESFYECTKLGFNSYTPELLGNYSACVSAAWRDGGKQTFSSTFPKQLHDDEKAVMK